MKPGMAIAALLLIGVAPFTAATTASRAEDIPPSAFAPQSQSDQPNGRTAPSRTGAQFTMQRTGSADGAQIVPLAQRVDPIVNNQPISGAANK
jgi:hypothetical protein